MHLTKRWSERLAALVPDFHEIPPSTRSDALSRQPSLILFSLDGSRLLLSGCSDCRLFAGASGKTQANLGVSTAEIRGWHAQAVVVALREFQKNQGGKTERGEPVYGDLAHYTLKIAKSPPDQLPVEYARQECLRVSFVPDMSAKDYRDVVLGGRTSYGIEVSYDVARRGMKIVKTSFAR